MIRKRGRGQAWLKKWMAGRKESFHESSTEAQIHQEDRQETMREAISQLDDAYRIPLILRFYENMDYDQIAQTLSEMEGAPVKRGTVASRLNRAKQQLKLAFEGNQP